MTERKKKVALVTGANSGIGLELTKKLIENGWEVVALIRSGFPEEELKLQQKIRQREIRIYRTDLSDFTKLKYSLGQIKEQEPKLDALFNNAGGSFPELLFSPQGRELHYEVQTVVPYIITMELLKLLKKDHQVWLSRQVQMHSDSGKHLNPTNWQNRKSFRSLRVHIHQRS